MAAPSWALAVAAAMTWAMTVGERVCSPRRTARIAAIMSLGWVSLSRNPEAPAASA